MGKETAGFPLHTNDTKLKRTEKSVINTFIKAGNKSLYVKYETRLVCHAPEVKDNATLIAFCRATAARISTPGSHENLESTYEISLFE